MKPNRKLKVLMLEDMDEDAELIQMQMKELDYACEFRRARNKKEYIRCCKSFKPDIILSDYNLPDFNGLQALQYQQANYPNTPFVLVTGSLGEEKAVETILSGASDFLLKQNLQGLHAAVLRALRVSEEQRARKEAVFKLKESEMYFRGLIENNHDPIFTFDEKNRITYASPAVKTIIGFEVDELVGRFIPDMLHPEDRTLRVNILKDLLSGKINRANVKLRIKTKNNGYRWMEAIISDQRELGAIHAFVTNLRDIHEYTIANEKLREKNMLIDSVLTNLNEGVIVADNDKNFILFNKAATKILGVDLFSVKYSDWAHGAPMYKTDGRTHFEPDELPLVRAINGEILNEVEMFIEYPQASGGSYISINSHPLKDDSGTIQGGVISFRNITDRKRIQLKLEKTLSELERRVIERTAEINKMHMELEEVHKHLLYSINYAKKLQFAIVPSEMEVRKTFSKSFVLYLPRDVVSGDFIWMHDGPGNHIAIADCTGHGVPGAMLSMIGNDLLDRIVAEKHIFEPDAILREMHTGFSNLLMKTDKSKQMNDGMDISLCSFDFESRQITFAGAMNNGLLIKKNSELVILSASRRSVGGGVMMDRFGKFENFIVPYEPGDRLYLYTDGFQDQFGGPNAKKFTKRRLLELLAEIQNYSMEDQHEIMLYKFNEWKRKQSQIDDVTLVGIEM